jgi:hypothetical protein
MLSSFEILVQLADVTLSPSSSQVKIMHKLLIILLGAKLLRLPPFVLAFSVVARSGSTPLSSTSMSAAAADASSSRSSCSSTEIYGIPGSGWQSPTWNWGYAQGTGHDCAAICRRQYATRASRQALVDNLLVVVANNDKAAAPLVRREPANFEEVKLILALAWQNGRWDGSDGGPRGGYGVILSAMAEAKRYEHGSNDECARRFIQDMADPKRFQLLPFVSDSAMQQMSSMAEAAVAGTTQDYDLDRRRCSGYVLQAMGFVERGL